MVCACVEGRAPLESDPSADTADLVLRHLDIHTRSRKSRLSFFSDP